MNLINGLSEFIQKYETTLPYSNKKVLFKPFRVKDAKILSIVLQENNKKIAFQSMIDLLKDCTTEINIEELCLADAEFLFLQIRSKSVDEMLNLIYNNEKVQVNVDQVKHRNEINTEQISLGNMTLVLETPTVKDFLRLNTFDKEEYRKIFIKKVIVNNEIYKLNKFVTEEIKEFIDNLPLSVLPKIDNFIKKQPELYLILETKEGEKEVSGLLSFFIFR